MLLYGSESWSRTEKLESKLQVFVNNCLRIILQIFWQQVISNKDLLERTGQLSWYQNSETKIQMDWTYSAATYIWGTETYAYLKSEEHQKKWSPAPHQRRKFNSKLENIWRTFEDFKEMAQNHQSWRRFVKRWIDETLCSDLTTKHLLYNSLCPSLCLLFTRF